MDGGNNKKWQIRPPVAKSSRGNFAEQDKKFNKKSNMMNVSLINNSTTKTR